MRTEKEIREFIEAGGDPASPEGQALGFKKGGKFVEAMSDLGEWYEQRVRGDELALEEAGEVQDEWTKLAIEESRLGREQQGEQFERQFEESKKRYGEMQGLLNPYVQAGENSLAQQQALSGALGPAAQQAAYDAIQGSAGFQSMLAQGERGILQNATATGGVRGGNTQGALARYSPQLLGQAIDQRYGQLGGLTQMGQASAAGVGAAGMSVVPGIQPTDNSIASMMLQTGQNKASNILAQAEAGRGHDIFDWLGLGFNAASIFI